MTEAEGLSPRDYLQLAVRTKSDKIFDLDRGDIWDCEREQGVDVIHAIFGLVTEAGEAMDVVKKAMFYGKPVDWVNLDEELGDIFWYLAVYCVARGLEFETLWAQNIAKLRVRFPDRFSQERALDRDLAAERQSLESGPKAPMIYDTSIDWYRPVTQKDIDRLEARNNILQQRIEALQNRSVLPSSLELGASVPRIYDINIDSIRPATQEDIDKLEEWIQGVGPKLSELKAFQEAFQRKHAPTPQSPE